MSYADDDFEQNEQDGPKALREALAKANKAIEAANKRIDDLANENSTLKLTDVFAKKNVPAALQRLMKAEKVEASPEAVEKWLSDNGSDFGWNPQAASTEKPEGQQAAPQEAPAVQQSVLSPEDVAAYERVQAVMAGATGQHLLSDQAEQAVTNAVNTAGLTGGYDDLDKLMEAYRAQGIPVESAFG